MGSFPREKIVLCADIGTSSLKAGYISIADRTIRNTRLAAFVREPYWKTSSIISCQDKVSVTEWEAAFRRAMVVLCKQAPDIVADAVCISGNGPTLIPVKKNGSALSPLYWFDRIEKEKSICSFFLPHVAGFMRKRPEEYNQTAKFFSCQEWFSYRLGAEPVTTLPTKEYERFYWSACECAALGIDRDLFPPFVKLGTVVGKVSAKAAREFGVPEGIPVVSGGPDFIMALLGAGTIAPGMVCDRAGSSEGINFCINQLPVSTTGFRILPHAIEGLWNISVVLPESGCIFEQWREENGRTEETYDKLMAELIPSINKDNAHFILLKIAAQVKDAIAAFVNLDIHINEMRLSGGQAKNARWNALKAKITECRLIALEIPDAELTGCAVAAMTALHDASSFTEACGILVRVKECFEPI
ncbi:MAG: FGGY-family carbohydrate kinase [Spirochaetaceae bacterium]|jgi:xylulokinase|nr:FGGY-family carbohydrate kinase [Spirochaetaceae bacterium]